MNGLCFRITYANPDTPALELQEEVNLQDEAGSSQRLVGTSLGSIYFFAFDAKK